LVVTKLDGSAKGGVLFALAREFGIPIRFIGLGEKPEDLREFDPVAYVDGLLPQHR
jgi:fused signal recognition particle receptor